MALKQAVRAIYDFSAWLGSGPTTFGKVSVVVLLAAVGPLPFIWGRVSFINKSDPGRPKGASIRIDGQAVQRFMYSQDAIKDVSDLVDECERECEEGFTAEAVEAALGQIAKAEQVSEAAEFRLRALTLNPQVEKMVFGQLRNYEQRLAAIRQFWESKKGPPKPPPK